MHPAVLSLWLTLAASALPGSAAPAAMSTGPAAETRHRAIVRPALAGSPLPADMLAPEGRTLWDLTGFAGGEPITISIQAGTDPQAAGTPSARLLVKEVAGAVREPGMGVMPGRTEAFEDLSATGAARRWLLPSQAGAGMLPGHRETLELHAGPGGAPGDGACGRTLRIDTEIAGIGWVHLPSGPREVVLQRALMASDSGGPGDGRLWRLAHRWIDPRAGVVAVIAGPASPDGRARLAVDEARVTDEVLLGAADLKIYVNQLDLPVRTSISYGWDRGAGASVSTLTPEGYTTIGALVAASSWNFSGVTSGAGEIASTGTPINSSETCNFNKCGYNTAGAELGREDKTGTDPNSPFLMKNNSATRTEQRAGDVTIWLTAGSQNEGVAGAFGSGETGFCYVSDGTRTRTPVPLYRFSNQDAGGWFMQVGDPAWTGGPGATCQQTLFNEVCDGGGFLSELWARSCPGHTGTQGGQVVKAGVVALPSGHTFNALLIKVIADFCVYSGSTCGFKVDEARTVNYIWQVPWLGTLVRLQSGQNVPDDTSWGLLDETDIKFGLFPPRSITVTGTTDTTISLSWDPGLDTHRISGYKIYWDTDSGGATPYAFNSVTHPGQVSIAGTTATISGLTSGLTYHLTVTSRSVHTDPSSGVVTTYESLLYPTQVSGDPSFIYPVEVMATPAPPSCAPTTEVGDVTVTDAGGGDIQICWEAATDPCKQGYRVIGSDDATSDAGYASVTDTGNVTCWTGNPDDTFFLVLTRSAAGTGPWGHYGR
jgi:hypothetical protein